MVRQYSCPSALFCLWQNVMLDPAKRMFDYNFNPVPPGSGHEEVLSRFTLKKLLLLVCFLDKAKESRLIEHDPCLFCMDAEFKVKPARQ